MKLRGLGVLVASGAVVLVTGWMAVGGFVATGGMDIAAQSTPATEADAADDVATDDATATPVQAPQIPAAAIVDAALFDPQPMGSANAATIQMAALNTSELAEKTGSIPAAADPAPKPASVKPAQKSVVRPAQPAAETRKVAMPRLDRDGTLTVAQISHIKASLNLTPDQERYWSPVEAELRQLVRQLAAQKAAGRRPTLALDAADAQRLYWAAGPLIMSLREDQKREVRRLARAMGLEQVASLI